MKNIQVVDGAENCVYDIFSISDEDFTIIFPSGTNIAFIDELYGNRDNKAEVLDIMFNKIWLNRINKNDANGINGILFYEMEYKKKYYPTRKDEEAINPDGSLLR